MNVSFSKTNEVGVVSNGACSPAESIPSCSALIPQVPMVAVAAPTFFDDGNITFDDVILPRLNCCQKVGELSEIFNPGELILSQTVVVHVPTNKERNVAGSGPLVIVPVGFKKTQFVEKVEGGGRGLFVNTEAEIVAAGGTLDYKEWQNSLGTANPKKRFERYATALILIEKPVSLLPDEEHQVFTHEVEGKFYALALFGMKGTWYTGMAKHLFTARKIGHLKGGYPTFSWNLTTEIKSFPNGKGGFNYAAVPILSNGSKTSSALQDYIKTGLGFGGG